MKKQKLKIKSNSLLIKLLLPMLVLNLALSLIFYGTIFFGGTMTELRKNAVDILNGTVSGRAEYLQREMLSVWGNFDENLLDIEETVSYSLKTFDKKTFDTNTFSQPSPIVLDGRNKIGDIGKNIDNGKDYLTEYILKNVTDDIIKLLRQNHVNGAYFILDGDADTLNKDGLYFRRSAISVNALDKSDLILLAAPSRATVDYCADFGTKTNSMDKLFFDSESGAEFYNVYNKVFTTAKKEAQRRALSGQSIVNGVFSENYAYWAPCYNFTNIVGEIISYNMPLVYDGQVYGIFGVDINVNTITPFINHLEIMGGSANGSYVISVRDKNDNSLNRIINSGILYNKLYSTKDSINKAESISDNCFRLESSENFDYPIYTVVKKLNLYNNNTPYEDMVWELAAIVEHGELFNFSSHLTKILLRSLFTGFGVSAVAVVALSIYISRPIKKIAAEVRSTHAPDSTYTKTNIYELDELVNEIQALTKNVADSASKLEQIIEVANVPIGAFEKTKGTDKIFYTGKFFELLKIPVEGKGFGYMGTKEFYAHLDKLNEYLHSKNHDGSEKLYYINDSWIRLNITESQDRTLGVVSDITQEVNEKETIEYERDHDLLTQLKNRRAFYNIASTLFENLDTQKTTAVLMIDLDRLKNINDNYGHEAGDKYINAMAQILIRHSSDTFYTARLSGDEFSAIIFGAESKDQIRNQINALMQDLKNKKITLDNGTAIELVASIGLAWCPQNSLDFYELLRYADSAMYKAKEITGLAVVEYEE